MKYLITLAAALAIASVHGGHSPCPSNDGQGPSFWINGVQCRCGSGQVVRYNALGAGECKDVCAGTEYWNAALTPAAFSCCPTGSSVSSNNQGVQMCVAPTTPAVNCDVNYWWNGVKTCCAVGEVVRYNGNGQGSCRAPCGQGETEFWNAAASGNGAFECCAAPNVIWANAQGVQSCVAAPPPPPPACTSSYWNANTLTCCSTDGQVARYYGNGMGYCMTPCTGSETEVWDQTLMSGVGGWKCVATPPPPPAACTSSYWTGNTETCCSTNGEVARWYGNGQGYCLTPCGAGSSEFWNQQLASGVGGWSCCANGAVTWNSSLRSNVCNDK